jgi:hypothetical protein
MRSTRSGQALLALAALLVAASARAGSTPTWDKVVTNGASRFKVLKQFANAAVLDKETGLVWEKTPSSGTTDWGDAQTICIGTPIGGRRGWRLPTAWELMTLSDPSVDTPSLTPGHPFENVSTDDNYWSSTADPGNAAAALRERFGTGGGGIILADKTSLARRWCVRAPGGQYGAQ